MPLVPAVGSLAAVSLSPREWRTVRFYAAKLEQPAVALSAQQSTVGGVPSRGGTPAPSIRRSVSTGALSVVPSGIAAAPGLTPSNAAAGISVASGIFNSLSAGNRSPAPGPIGSSVTRPLKIVTRPPTGAAPSMSLQGSPIESGGGYMAFPPTIHATQLQGQLSGNGTVSGHNRSNSSRLARHMSHGSASPSPLNLPPSGRESSSSHSGSASPSPKLSPSLESMRLSGSSNELASLNSLVNGSVGGRLIGAKEIMLHERHLSSSGSGSLGTSLPVKLGVHVPPRVDTSAFYSASTASTPRSNQSSPGLYPATPHMSGPLREPIVVTGVSLGLPNDTFGDAADGVVPAADDAKHNEDAPASASSAASKPAPVRPGIFSRVNFDRIFSGQSCIAHLTPADKSAMVGMRASQISKDKATGSRVKKFLTEDKQLIQVASKMSPRDSWNLAKEFGLPSHVMEVLDATYELAVCAGLEALRDAGFNLNIDPKKASSPEEIGLPESMRDETGVIFASSFPCLDSIVQEVTAKVRYDTQQELFKQLQMERPIPLPTKNSDGSADDAFLQEASYEYDRKLLFKLLVMANSQLAELIKARGPNIHINTACSGTTQAIATAEDWMRVGRCKRVIVVAADVATSPACMPYLATGFLALGAASILPDPVTAAAPFDVRRQGMVLGAGSVGLVLEYATSALSRGALPKVELLGSHQGNSAFHATLMDSISISQQLHVFLRRIELEQRADFIFSGSAESVECFTKDLIYFAHETFTSANGGCAGVEMQALASIWPGVLGGGSEPTATPTATSCSGKPNPHVLTGSLGLARSEILIANSKGFTGHPMGVGFEDVLAVESLVQGRVPPMANFRTLDPRLAAIVSAEQMSRGGKHDRKFVLRMAGGFGNQFVYVLYRKWNEANQLTWAGRLAASSTSSSGGGGSSAHGRSQVHALRHAAGAYSYPLQVAESPNSCSTSTFVSRTNSEFNLAGLANQAGQ